MSTKEDESEREAPTVLVVEDERGLADLYSLWLSEHYNVRTAYSGSEALSLLDGTVDIVLLDRRMPEMSGDEVLQEIRDRGYDCQVSMLTAVPPEEEVADLPIDEYLTKPIDSARIKKAIDELTLRLGKDTSKQELLALISRKVTLEREHGKGELADSEKYNHLVQRIEKTMNQLDVSSQHTPSKYRPASCPACDLRWDIQIEDTVGFIDLGSHSWKCVQCGEFVQHRGPSHRRISRR